MDAYRSLVGLSAAADVPGWARHATHRRPRIFVRYQDPIMVGIRGPGECPCRSGAACPAGLGEVCDPTYASCPVELDPDAVRMDLPQSWIDTFTKPYADEIDEASADQSTWETWIAEYTTRCGMAFAKLRGNMVAYTQDAWAKLTALREFIAQHATALSADQLMQLRGMSDQLYNASLRAQNTLDQLNSVARGESVVACNIPAWRFAIVPRSDLPIDAPTPISVEPFGVGVTGAEIIVIVIVASIMTAGAAIAWWAAAAETSEPREIDARAREEVAKAQADSQLKLNEIARDLAASGRPEAAADLLEQARRRFNEDIRSLTEPEHARAEEAAAGAKGESMGDMIKMILVALFALKALELSK